ncbi:MAG: OmpH family outer membrane protein [Desulfovermiculus sp.]
MHASIRLSCFVLLGLFLLPNLALAENLKIGVVDLQKIMEESEPGQKAIKELQSEFTEKKGELDSRKAAIEELRSELQKQSMVLSQEAQEEKAAEYRQKVNEFQKLYQTHQRRMQQKEEELRAPIIEVLVEIIREYGQKNGYTLLMDKNNSGVIYNDQAIEITDAILSEFGKAWKNRSE